MKTFEVTIRKNRTPSKTEFVWPKWWNELAEKVDVVAYEDEGKASEGAICVCDDDTWALIDAKHSQFITLRTAEEANTKGRKWRPQVEKIVDDKAVLSVLAKAARGEPLSLTDRQVIDPGSSTRGVNKTPAFDVAKIMEEKEHGKAKNLHRNT